MCYTSPLENSFAQEGIDDGQRRHRAHQSGIKRSCGFTIINPLRRALQELMVGENTEMAMAAS